jgi:hypothetical protein
MRACQIRTLAETKMIRVSMKMRDVSISRPYVIIKDLPIAKKYHRYQAAFEFCMIEEELFLCSC